MPKTNTDEKPIHYSKTTLNELLLVYQNYFIEEGDMQSKFSRKTMNEILKQDNGFMDRLMYVVENNPYLRSYVQNMVITPKEPSEPSTPPKGTYPTPTQEPKSPAKPAK